MAGSYYLSNEVWINILQYVPLQDRVRSVQYVSKLFNKLCTDTMLLTSLNFEDCIFMSEKLCLKIIRKAKKCIRFLCFRNCSWFGKSMYQRMPKLSRLVTLDILGCTLNGSHIFALLSSSPSIANLALTLTEGSLCEFNECEPAPSLNVEILHIEYMVCHSHDGSMDTLDVAIKHQLKVFMKACFQNEHRYVSININNPIYDPYGRLLFLNNMFPLIHDAVGSEPAKMLFCTNLSRNRYANLLKSVGLHCYDPNSAKGSFNNIRIIVLNRPVRRLEDEPNQCICKGGLYPMALPHLGYLALPPELILADLSCYGETAGSILMKCDVPKLLHLNLGVWSMNKFTVPSNMYDRLASFTSLVELNVSDIFFDLFELLDALKCLKHLSGLSLQVNISINAKLQSNIEEDVVKSGRISRVSSENTTFFKELVSCCPHLKKLELSYWPERALPLNAIVLKPIATLLRLENLMLRSFLLMDIQYLEAILRDCVEIKSLTLDELGLSAHCEYPKFSKCLRSMQSLNNLNIIHAHLGSSTVFADVSMCKNLHRLVVRSPSVPFSSSVVSNALIPLIRNCKLLCMCSLGPSQLSDASKRALSKLGKELKVLGRNVVISYDITNCDSLDHVARSFICRTQSPVATLNPYDFFMKT